MAFPVTQHSLIRRLATTPQEADWQQFLADYWNPVCRFSIYRTGISPADAEEVASDVFLAILKGELLSRWQANRTAKLRTLICSVVRNILSNRARVSENRQRLAAEQRDNAVGELPNTLDDAADVAANQLDAFYAAWAEDVLVASVDGLMQELYAAGKGDYFRVLYGRLCEDMTMTQVGAALGITVATSDNYFRSTKQQLTRRLERIVRQHVERYCDEDAVNDEFQSEWHQLANFLAKHGGLEEAVRKAYREHDQSANLRHESQAFKAILKSVHEADREKK